MEGEIISVRACRHCQTGVAWCEVDMRIGREAESVCGASAPLVVSGGGGRCVGVWTRAVGGRSAGKGGVGACDCSSALMGLPRLCLSKTNSDHITELDAE